MQESTIGSRYGDSPVVKMDPGFVAVREGNVTYVIDTGVVISEEYPNCFGIPRKMLVARLRALADEIEKTGGE